MRRDANWLIVYYHLKFVSMNMPESSEDIVLLARFFLHDHTRVFVLTKPDKL